MLSKECMELEKENRRLKLINEELKQKIESGSVSKPKSCQYCKNFIQHYMKNTVDCRVSYTPVYYGHCACSVPIYKGKKRKPTPDDTCPYFECGTKEERYI